MTGETFQRIVDERVIAVVRGVAPSEVVDVARTINAGGVGVVEVTADSPSAADAIGRIRDELPHLLVGAGTVLEAASLQELTDAGARFIVSPVVDEGVIDAAARRGVVAIPGAFTPTEVRRGLTAGADAVKIFPATSGGPAHVASIRGPLGDVPLVPTGGVTADNAGGFIDAGAVAVGVGSAIVDHAAIEAGDLSVIRDNTQAIVDAVSDRSN